MQHGNRRLACLVRLGMHPGIVSVVTNEVESREQIGGAFSHEFDERGYRGLKLYDALGGRLV